MEDFKNTKTINSTTIHLPSLIIDKSGRIIAQSNEVRKIIPSASPQLIFFELFDESNLLILQKIFIESRKYDSAARDLITLKIGNEAKTYEVTISPLRSENNVYFIVCFSAIDSSKSSTETKRFIIATNEIEKITNDKKLLGTINKIKLTFPFTFIEKAKLQKEINEIDQLFWLKDPDGKYIIVNEKYSKELGFSSSQLENKYEQDYLPKYLVNLYKTVDQYILATTNAIILDGSSSPVSPGQSKNIQIVQFPLCDLDNKVVAIIGFSQITSQTVVTEKDGINKNFFKTIPHAFLLTDSGNKISFYTTELRQLLLIPEKTDFTKSDISKIFEKDLTQKIFEYLNDNTKIEPLNFTYKFSEKVTIHADVGIEKYFDQNDNYIGSKISLVPKNELQLIIEGKAELYDTLINNLPEAMFIYDLENLKFLEVNEAALKLYGYKRNEFLNMDLTDLYAPEDIQTLIQSSETKMLNAGPWRHKKSDGSSILVELIRTSVNYKGKKSHLNIVKNVTEEIEDKKQNQILQFAFEHSNDMIINTDKDGFITFSNEQVSKKLGYPKKELEARPFISLVSDDDRAKVNRNIFHSGLLKTTSIELDFKKPSGTLIKCIVIASPIKNYNGEIESFSLILKPVEEKSESQAIKHAQEDISEKFDPPFLSNMFHEILTPINVILGFSQEIWESISNPTAEQKEAVEIIKENQKLLLQIMDNAVEYSTLQQKVVKFRPEQIKFVDLLTALKENTQKSADSKKIELAYGKISSSLVLESDKQKLISLLSLFIKIAIQISKEKTIYLSAYNFDENNIVVCIRDSKKAITPYLLKGFNDVFSDEEAVVRRNYGFSRFSLRLSNKLIELLSAKKQVITKENEAVDYGLIFPIKFTINEKANYELESVKPSVQIEEKVAKPNLQDDEQLRQKQPKTVEIDLTQLNVLYLEDQVDSQILFKSQMKDLKSIECVPSFETALPLLKTKRFDFIIMDINLQGEYNGLDALRIIQKMPGYKDIPIIATTAYTQAGARDNFMAAGFSDFVAKPLLRDKIIEAFKRSLSK